MDQAAFHAIQPDMDQAAFYAIQPDMDQAAFHAIQPDMDQAAFYAIQWIRLILQLSGPRWGPKLRGHLLIDDDWLMTLKLEDTCRLHLKTTVQIIAGPSCTVLFVS